MHNRIFSPQLQSKINTCLEHQKKFNIGDINLANNLLLAPMAGICTPPFRLLMEDLGAGATVSELISCHGINYGNEKTLEMLKIDEREKNIGIQLFGEDGPSMAKAAQVVLRYNPRFIDINMGCPVRKVVTKGGGSALLKDPEKLAPFFYEVKKSIPIPLTIKIRTGWDSDSLNADIISEIARNEGVEWVAIHGRTRVQQYTGQADWDYIETLASTTKIPIIGNGDLHRTHQVRTRMKNTNCKALMIARGCLRNPFIFLESFLPENSEIHFDGNDYWEVIEKLFSYICDTYDNERAKLVQMRKLIVWFAAGFPGAAKFRGHMFSAQTLDESLRYAEDFYLSLKDEKKHIDYGEAFMNSGHG